jgi:phosphomannomutase
VKDIATQLGAKYFESAVGEINVVELMKEKKSIIGGEGSGGVIFALSHYGRDALVGIALFLSYLSTINLSVKALKSFLPNYYMMKEKVLLKLDSVFNFEDFIKYQIKLCKNNNQHYLLIDGIKIYYSCGSWAHIRTSNTEPIVRLIIESEKQTDALGIKSTLINDINNFLQ